MEKQRFTGKGGKSIRAYRWEPDSDEIRAVVQIVHGMAEHALRYNQLAEQLTARGFAVAANDHRGHGQTDPVFRGFIPGGDGFHLMTDDLNTFYLQILKRYEEIPRFVLGHSMGTTLVLRMLQLYPLKPDGVILSGPPDPSTGFLKEGALLARLLGLLFGRSTASPLLTRLTFSPAQNQFKPARTDFDWLSRDEKAVDQYIEDPACGFVCTNSFYRDFFKGINTVYQKKNLELIDPEIPVYLLAGSHDPFANADQGVEGLRKRFKQAGIDDLTMQIYEEGRHEMFNETNRGKVTGELINWIEKHLKPGNSKPAIENGSRPSAL